MFSWQINRKKWIINTELLIWKTCKFYSLWHLALWSFIGIYDQPLQQIMVFMWQCTESSVHQNSVTLWINVHNWEHTFKSTLRTRKLQETFTAKKTSENSRGATKRCIDKCDLCDQQQIKLFSVKPKWNEWKRR